ncbi:MAG: hypothetical protein KIC54_01230 [Clostridium sp.]|nr:hypothetical protein [Clostridium sp.]
MENEFTIKETANAIGQTVQNLYRKIPELKKLGYAREDENGNKFITIEGVNYLRDKIINSKRPTKEEERQETEEKNVKIAKLETEKEFLEKQLAEEKAKNRDLQDRYDKKDEAFNKISVANAQYLIDTSKQIQAVPEKKKFSLFRRNRH